MNNTQAVPMVPYASTQAMDAQVMDAQVVSAPVLPAAPATPKERLITYIDFLRHQPLNEDLQAHLVKIDEYVRSKFTQANGNNSSADRQKLITAKIMLLEAIHASRFYKFKAVHDSYTFELPLFFNDLQNPKTYISGFVNDANFKIYSQYCKHNFVDKALEIFKSISPSLSGIKYVEYYGEIIPALVRNDRIDEAMLLLKELSGSKDIQSNNIMYRLMLEIAPKLIESGQIEMVIAVLDYEDANFPSNKQRSEVYLQIFNALSQNGQLARARTILEDPKKLLFSNDRITKTTHSNREKVTGLITVPQNGVGRINRKAYNSLVRQFSK